MTLRTRRWLPAAGPVVARLVVVHGLGEHAGRYDEVARHLAGRGVAVLAHDQRGHGRSGGRPGCVDDYGHYLDDLDRVLERARVSLPEPGEGAPFLLGHSLGGLVVLRYLQQRRPRVSGAVISAPWLATAADVPVWKRAASLVLRHLAPRLTLATGMDATQLTRDPEKQREYDEDPRVHSRISAGLHAEVEAAQARALAGRPPPDIPLLFLIPGDDPLADASTTGAYADALAGDVTVERIPDGRHEPLNDLGRTAVYETVTGWLTERAAREPESTGRVDV